MSRVPILIIRRRYDHEHHNDQDADLDTGPLHGPSPAESLAAVSRAEGNGPAVWLEKYRMFALTRYDVVVRVLRDWEGFPSAFGVMMNDDMNQVLRGNTLCSDGDAHNRLRRVVIRPVTPAALKSLEDEVEREAEGVVDRLCARGRFCATGELATYLPVTIVSNAVGLPEEGTRANDGVEHRHVQLLRPDE